jgi:hypothetical protein
MMNIWSEDVMIVIDKNSYLVVIDIPSMNVV